MCNACPKPRDETRIQAGLKQFKANRPPRTGAPNRGAPNRGPNPQNRPPFKKIDGRAMKLNKKGVYVLDQKEVRDRRTKDTLQLALAALGQSGLAPTSSPPARTPETPIGLESQRLIDRVTTVRTVQEALADLL
jgi:hypothetical protein